jgi:hypothetical protein
MSIKNSNENIENRTCNIPDCSAVPQPTAPPYNLDTGIIPQRCGMRDGECYMTITWALLEFVQQQPGRTMWVMERSFHPSVGAGHVHYSVLQSALARCVWYWFRRLCQKMWDGPPCGMSDQNKRWAHCFETTRWKVGITRAVSYFTTDKTVTSFVTIKSIEC